MKKYMALMLLHDGAEKNIQPGEILELDDELAEILLAVQAIEPVIERKQSYKKPEPLAADDASDLAEE